MAYRRSFCSRGAASRARPAELFGKLPGDIRIESERSRTFIPLTSMLILSMVLLNLFRR